MRFIIDTHALIWYIAGTNKLSKETISIINDVSNDVYVSKASLWELAIKISLGKLKISIPFETLESYLSENEFAVLDFNFQHLKTLLELPYLHGDPFDRMIISQAITDNLNIISHDEEFSKYSIKVTR